MSEISPRPRVETGLRSENSGRSDEDQTRWLVQQQLFWFLSGEVGQGKIRDETVGLRAQAIDGRGGSDVQGAVVGIAPG